MSARLLVVMHEDDCPPGWFGDWFLDAGVRYDAWPAHRTPLPDHLSGYDGLVVLGGEMGAYDDADHPWLTDTKRLIAAAVTDTTPFLGICLGHQLAAVALGGEVRRNTHGHARGLTPFRPNAAGRVDPLLGAVDDGAPALQWNRDVVTRLPTAATELATSPDGTVQAARFGQCAWGVQFHPETSPEIFYSWTLGDGVVGQPAEVDVPAAYAAVLDGEAELRRSWQSLAFRFAELVSSPEAL
ncbi:MAG: type 1 glutamine amidotransferase [Nocardioidaceae bacterium]